MGLCTSKEPKLDLDKYLGRWYEVARNQKENGYRVFDYHSGMKDELIVVEWLYQGHVTPRKQVRRVSLEGSNLIDGWRVLSTNYRDFSFLTATGACRILSRRQKISPGEKERLEEQLLNLGHLDDELEWL